MEYYSSSGNKIMIAHFPGSTKVNFSDDLNNFSKRKFHCPDNIDFICPYTKDTEDSAVLVHQLSDNGYSYYNSLEGRNMIWEPAKKVHAVRDSLYMATNDYCLILDTNDVAVLMDIDDIFDRFDTYKKEFPKLKVLYNASIWMHPHVIVDNVEDRWKYAPYSYLNAGCCFGEREYLIDFYEECCNEVNNSGKNIVDSEQYYVRKVFDKYQDEVFFDYDCRIFQCWHKQEYKYETDPDTGEEKCILL